MHILITAALVLPKFAFLIVKLILSGHRIILCLCFFLTILQHFTPLDFFCCFTRGKSANRHPEKVTQGVRG